MFSVCQKLAAGFVLLAAAGTRIYGDPIPELRLEEPRISIRNESAATLQAVRYPPPPGGHGRPILLAHGLTNNTRVWRELARRLRAEGYDVWMFNFRHHGQGDHLSAPEETRTGHHEFPYLITEDMEAMVEEIYTRTHQRVLIAGHSTGGMVAIQYERGVIHNGYGGLRIDPAVRARRAQMLSRVIAIGSPGEFENPGRDLQALAALMRTGESALPRRIPLPFGLGRAPTAPDPTGLIARTRRRAIRAARPAVMRAVPRGVWNRTNNTPEEITALIEKGFSDHANPELLQNFAYWIDSGRYEDRSSHFTFRHSDSPITPTLFISGELDSLAPAQNMQAAMERMPPGSDIRQVTVSNRGHMDLIAGESAAGILAPLLAAFDRDAESIAPRGTVRIEGPCQRPSVTSVLSRLLGL